MEFAGVTLDSPGRRFRSALESETPLQIVGAINAYCAMLAQRAGFSAVYLSGAGVANGSHGLPDLGVTTISDVSEDARRIAQAVSAPLLVDIDTGWGSPLTMERTIREMERAGVAAVHLEDQVEAKRCGHRDGKQLVSTAEMLSRLKAALAARQDADFFVIARTDAVAVEGFDAAIERANRYVEAGADGVFAEALTSLEEVSSFCKQVPAPVLINITEFGKTPLFSVEELRTAGARMILYPLSAFRAMSKAAERVFSAIREQGTQSDVVADMQTREELYDVLGYHEAERKLDP